MAYCRNCGTEVVSGAKYCQKCGAPVVGEKVDGGRRKQEFEGKVYKCPNCGEVLKSFTRNCPCCGLELRGVRSSSAVREFSLKLEAIEARREPERAGFFSDDKNRISNTDEQKISLIQSFVVPNTKEDMLEFMILATSNINVKSFDGYDNINMSKGEQALNQAWVSKAKQVYEKAERSYGDEADFDEIKKLYDECNVEIKESKRKGKIKLVFLFGWVPMAFALLMIVFLVIFGLAQIFGPQAAKEENSRLEAIQQETEYALEQGEYKKALLNAEALKYNQDWDAYNGREENERKWDIERELLIDRILDEAEKNGVHLDRPPDTDEESNSDD